ncbi:DMT family transporter [Mesorhizobium sp. AR10]|uniref:DMT family transporter n=1 Tax=Mesorhizobium sp. AR10 TaxID=2865839 RepID=UPI00215E81D1|nr:DMT family transporter [Mesorhizobium sp. AR10]UVK40294.1 DMT family transporter [Mesorhizobium sp. AR10]
MQNRILLGIFCLCVGVAVFSLQDALIKDISGAYPVTEAIAIRAIVAMPILLAVVHLDTGVGAIFAESIGFLTVRALIMFGAYGTYYLALPALPLADAVALFFTTPLFILLLAGPYLGERVSWKSLVSVAAGMIGVVIMLRPGASVFEWAGLLSLFSAALYALSQLMARKVSVTVTAPVMTFYQNGVYLAGALLIAGLFMALGIEHAAHPSLEFLVRPWTWPTTIDFLKMAACGVIASAGMLLLSQAYRLAPANSVATFEYTGIIWSPLWGLLFFAEVPQSTTVIGAALIVGAGLFALNAGRRKERGAAFAASDPA